MSLSFIARELPSLPNSVDDEDIMSIPREASLVKIAHLHKNKGILFPERVLKRTVGTAQMHQEMRMKTTVLTVCTLVLSTSFALAQPSQGQAGAATGPTSNSPTSASGMNNDGINSGSGMQSGTTTGMSSGGGSGMTNSGGANGTPNSMPRTTTGPTGAASKDESPAK